MSVSKSALIVQTQCQANVMEHMHLLSRVKPECNIFHRHVEGDSPAHRMLPRLFTPVSLKVYVSIEAISHHVKKPSEHLLTPRSRSSLRIPALRFRCAGARPN